MGTKEELLAVLRASRKKNGKMHPKTFKAIYNIVRRYPYYDGYEEKWLETNGFYLR